MYNHNNYYRNINNNKNNNKIQYDDNLFNQL